MKTLKKIRLLTLSEKFSDKQLKLTLGGASGWCSTSNCSGKCAVANMKCSDAYGVGCLCNGY